MGGLPGLFTSGEAPASHVQLLFPVEQTTLTDEARTRLAVESPGGAGLTDDLSPTFLLCYDFSSLVLSQPCPRPIDCLELHHISRDDRYLLSVFASVFISFS